MRNAWAACTGCSRAGGPRHLPSAGRTIKMPRHLLTLLLLADCIQVQLSCCNPAHCRLHLLHQLLRQLPHNHTAVAAYRHHLCQVRRQRGCSHHLRVAPSPPQQLTGGQVVQAQAAVSMAADEHHTSGVNVQLDGLPCGTMKQSASKHVSARLLHIKSMGQLDRSRSRANQQGAT